MIFMRSLQCFSTVITPMSSSLCSTYRWHACNILTSRNLDWHNAAMRTLHQIFPFYQFLKLIVCLLVSLLSFLFLLVLFTSHSLMAFLEPTMRAYSVIALTTGIFIHLIKNWSHIQNKIITFSTLNRYIITWK